MALEKLWVRFLFFFAVLVVACPGGLGQTDNLVSLIQLIATPERYAGKRIEVIGFLRLEYEGDMLYLHEDDYKCKIYENAVWIGVNKKQRQDFEDRNLHYVLIVGTFKAGNSQILMHANGTIVNITEVKIWPIERPSN